MSDDSSLIQDFLTEVKEHLASIENDLLRLEHAKDDPDLLNRVFRAVHTIKGGSGFLPGMDAIADLAHACEDLLARLRDGSLVTDTLIVDVLLKAARTTPA